jgi:hypothetical protein
MKPSVVAANLRRIASALSNSKNPSKALVARDLKRILSAISSDGFTPYYQAKLTDYDGMNDPSGMKDVESHKIMEHLRASQDNAIVLKWAGQDFAVWPADGGFYYQALPLEDPNDAEFVSGSEFPDFLYAIDDQLADKGHIIPLKMGS